MINWQESKYARQPQGIPGGGRFAGKGEKDESVIVRNLGWIYSRVRSWNNRDRKTLTPDELESAALAGALQATRSFDPKKAKFPSWSSKFIDGTIRREIRETRNIIHIPDHRVGTETFTYADVDLHANVATPDFLTEALARLEEASKNKTLQFRTKKVMDVLKKHLTERQLKVYFLVTVEKQSTRQLGKVMGVSYGTIHADYHKAKDIVEALKVKQAFKSTVPDALPNVRAFAERVHRTARLMANYHRIREYGNIVPPEFLPRLSATLAATIRQLLVQDRLLAEHLLNPLPLEDADTLKAQEPQRQPDPHHAQGLSGATVELFDVVRAFGDLCAGEHRPLALKGSVLVMPLPRERQRIQKPGSRGGHFHITRRGMVDYGPLPTGRPISHRADLAHVRDRHLRTFLETTLSEQTLRAYRADLEDFFQTRIETLTVDTICRTNLEDVLAYRDRLLRTQQPATVSRKLSTLRNLFQYLIEMKILEDNPARKRLAKAPRVSMVSTTLGLTEAEAKRLLATPDRSTVTGKRDYALLYLLLTTGLRRAEIPPLRYDDVRLLEDGGGDLRVTGKGGRRRVVFMKPTVLNALREYLTARGWKDGPLFHAHSGQEALTAEGVRFILAHHFKQAGLLEDAEGRPRQFSPHSLRHTAATLALDGGAPPVQVQAMLGHADLRTTYRYYRNPKVEAARYIPL